MWNNLVNSDTIISNFKDEFNKDILTKGSWLLDYIGMCEKFDIIRCPFFNVLDGVLKIQNNIIDLSSWRCMLLALAIPTSNINEIYIHNCQLSSQHIIDLLSTILKLENNLKSLRLEYLYFENDDMRISFFEALDSIFAPDIKIDYISLRGNTLTDEIIKRNVPAIQSNFSLKSLNLSDNKITDLGANLVFRILRTNNFLKEISLSNNKITGEGCLDTLGFLVLGSLQTSEDEAILKSTTKLLQENNKKIKEINKKRKKLNLVEFSEFLISKKDQGQKIEGQLTLCNRSIIAIDLSLNFLIEQLVINLFVKLKSSDAAVLVNTFGSCSLTLLLKSSPISLIQIKDSTLIPQLKEIGISIHV